MTVILLAGFLQKLEERFPKLENDISLRMVIDKMPQLVANPEPAAVAQLFVEMEEVFATHEPWMPE